MRKKPTKRPRGRPRKATVERGPDPAYLTIDEFCTLFAISRQSWPTHRPYLKTIQFGNRVLIPRAEVDRYIDSLTRPAQKAGAPKRQKPPAPREQQPSR